MTLPSNQRAGYVSRLLAASLLLLGLNGYGDGWWFHPVAAQTDQSASATKGALTRATELLVRAGRLEEEGKLQEAFDAAQEAARTFRAISGLVEKERRQYMEAQVYSLLGKILARGSYLEDAIAAWTEAMRFYDRFYEADIEFWRPASRQGSGFEHAAHNIVLTLEFLAEANEALKRPEDAIASLRTEGAFLNKLGQHQKAIETLRRIVTIIETNPHLPHALRRRAQALSDVALVLANAGRSAESLPLLEEAAGILAGVPHTGDPELAFARAELRATTGYALQGVGRHTEAVPVLLEAASDFADIGGHALNHVRALERLSLSLLVLERLQEAAEALKQQIEVARSAAGLEREGYMARSHLMVVYGRRGDYTLAKAEFTALREIAARAQIPVSDQVLDYWNIGVMHREYGAHRDALDSFGAAIRLLEGQPGTEVERAEYHIDLANALIALNRHDEARDRLQRGLRLIDGAPAGAIVAGELRRSLAEDDERRLGHRGALMRECERTVTALAGRPGADALILSCLGDIGREQQRSGRAEDAIATFRQAFDRLGESRPFTQLGGRFEGDPSRKHERWVVLTGLGLALVAAGRNREATTNLLAAAGLGRDRFLDALIRMPMLERYRHMEIGLNHAAAANIAVALHFQAADTDAAPAFESALSRKSLFTEVTRWQREAISRAHVRDSTLTRRYVELRQRVARHVIDWQRGAVTTGVESEVVEALFKEIHEVEGKLLRPIQSGALSAAKEASGLAGRIASVLGSDQVLLEFIRFAPIDVKAVRDMDLSTLVPDDPSKQHYGVFIVSGATRQVTSIDLGAVARIDDAVIEYAGSTNASPRRPASTRMKGSWRRQGNASVGYSLTQSRRSCVASGASMLPRRDRLASFPLRPFR